MARKELASLPLVDFRAELLIAMTSYYEGILKLEGASGERKAVAAYKHKIRPMIPPPAAKMSRYERPASFISHSSNRSPVQHAWV